MNRAIARKTDCSRVEVLVYHFVTERPSPFSRGGHVVHPAMFRDQIRWLKQHYDIVRVRDIPELQAGSRPSIAITFDDGYQSNLDEAYPILEQERVPASLFVCPSVLDNANLLWRDKIRYIVASSLETKFVDFLRSLRGRQYRFDLLASRGLHSWSKDPACVGDMAIQSDLENFFDHLGLSPAALAHEHSLFASAAALVSRPYLELGNHTWSHPVMTTLPLARQRTEISRADKQLRALGIDPVGLALPFSHFDDNTLRVCGEIGYRVVLTVSVARNHMGRHTSPLVVHRRLAPPSMSLLRAMV